MTKFDWIFEPLAPLRAGIKVKGNRIVKHGYYRQDSPMAEKTYVKPLIQCEPDVWLDLYNEIKQKNDVMIEVFDVSPDRHFVEMELIGDYKHIDNTIKRKYPQLNPTQKKNLIVEVYEKTVSLVKSSKQIASNKKIFVYSDFNICNFVLHNNKLHLIDVDAWYPTEKFVGIENKKLQKFYDWIAEQYKLLDLGKIELVYY